MVVICKVRKAANFQAITSCWPSGKFTSSIVRYGYHSAANMINYSANAKCCEKQAHRPKEPKENKQCWPICIAFVFCPDDWDSSTGDWGLVTVGAVHVSNPRLQAEYAARCCFCFGRS